LVPTLTRPGILNATWKALTSTLACCSSAFFFSLTSDAGAGAITARSCLKSDTAPIARAGGGGDGYCTISDLRSGALPPRVIFTVETASATFDQSSPVVWVMSARRISSSAGLRSFVPVSSRASYSGVQRACRTA